MTQPISPRPQADFDLHPSEDEIRFFNENGYLVVERMTTDEEIAWMREIFEFIFSEENADSADAPVRQAALVRHHRDPAGPRHRAEPAGRRHRRGTAPEDAQRDPVGIVSRVRRVGRPHASAVPVVDGGDTNPGTTPLARMRSGPIG